MTTFSQLVDEIVSETKRPDLVSDISRYLNQTIRECHFDPKSSAAIFYKENFRESLETATVAEAYSWAQPNPTTFQKMRVVLFSSQRDRSGNAPYAKETVPGRHLNELDYYFYQVGGDFVFSGYGGLNASIALGWFEFPASLKYYTAANRPASYDVESGWTYHDGVTTDEDKEAARLVSTNWLLMRWRTVIEEGLRAKAYKRTADDTRARTAYSLYAQLRQGLTTSEQADLGGPR